MSAKKSSKEDEVPVVVLDDGDFSKREVVISPGPHVEFYIPNVEQPRR